MTGEQFVTTFVNTWRDECRAREIRAAMVVAARTGRRVIDVLAIVNPSFPGSSVVEHLTVNQTVDSSILSPGARS